MANRVPFGIAVAGSFKSPDKLAPATIPVIKKNLINKERIYGTVVFYLKARCHLSNSPK